MKTLSLFILLTCLFPAVVRAEALTLEHVVEVVLATHPQILMARQEADTARHEKIAQSWFSDPKLGFKFEQVPVGSSGPNSANMKTFSFSQDIVFPATLVVQKASLNAKYQANQANVTQTSREIIFEIKEAYFSLLAVRELLKINRTIYNQYAQGQVILEVAYKSLADKNPKNAPMTSDGSSLFEGVLMAKIKKAETQARINELVSAEKTLESKLNLMMGHDAPDPVPALTTPQLKRIKLSSKVLEEKLLGQNAALKVLDFMSEKSQKDVALAKLSYVPTIMPEFEYNQRANQTDAYTLGLSLNVPLWIHRHSAQIQSARARQKQAQALWANEKLKTTTELYAIYNELTQQFETLSLYKNNILPTSRSLVDTALVSQSAGGSSSLMTLQKLLGYHQANTTYWEMWRNYQIAYALLEKLVGEDL
ncbi:MAG TPA: TolC family protein [bacterium]|nr:TolC family protein [bacterium]